MNVRVYSKTMTSCPQCKKTKDLLKRQGISFVEESLEENSEARDRFVAMGHMSAPIVEVSKDDGTIQRWSGFNLDMIRSLA